MSTENCVQQDVQSPGGIFFLFQTEEFTPSFYADENNLVDKENQSYSKKREQPK